MKTRIKKKSFWIALAGLAVIVLQSFGVRLDAPVINEVMSAVSGLLVMLGILVDDTQKAEKIEEKEDGVTEIE